MSDTPSCAESRQTPASVPMIALDAMGGDQAPGLVIRGAALALARNPSLRFLIFGDQARIQPLLDQHPDLAKVSTLRHCTDVITPDMKPSLALRQGRQSSMRLAINAVAEGEAASIVSAGNTGALMALAKFVLRMLPGIDRPAIASVMPTKTGEVVLLDLGANLECDPENLVQFAMMGSLFCRAVLGVEQPTIGLLNIGTEEMKGHDEIRTAATILQERPVPGIFRGFVEGNDILAGTVDVVVTDGFTGNVALKTIEGTAQLLAHFLRETFGSGFFAKIGYLLARKALAHFKMRVDPRRYNGALFLGLQGVCVKSHGGTDEEGFANAIRVANNLVKYGLNRRIAEELALHYGALPQVGDAPALTLPAANGSV